MFSRKLCSNCTPEERGRDDTMVLGSTLFTVFISLFVVLFS